MSSFGHPSDGASYPFLKISLLPVEGAIPDFLKPRVFVPLQSDSSGYKFADYIRDMPQTLTVVAGRMDIRIPPDGVPVLNRPLQFGILLQNRLNRRVILIFHRLPKRLGKLWTFFSKLRVFSQFFRVQFLLFFLPCLVECSRKPRLGDTEYVFKPRRAPSLNPSQDRSRTDMGGSTPPVQIFCGLLASLIPPRALRLAFASSRDRLHCR